MAQFRAAEPAGERHIRLIPGLSFRSELTRRVARNALFTLLGRTWYVALWFLVTPFVLRSLGSERFGVWSLLFLLSGYLTTFDLGLGAALVKFAAQHAALSEWDRLRNLTARALRIYAILGAIWVAGVAWFQPAILHWLRISPEHAGEVRFALLAGAMVFAAANLVGTGVGVLNGLQRMDLSNAILVGVSLPQMAVLIVGLRTGHGLFAVVASTFVQWALTFVFTWMALRKVAPQLGWPGVRPGSGGAGWWSFSVAVQINGVLAITQQQVDKILLTTFAGLRAVTEFELAFRVANAVQSLPVLLLSPLLPAFTELHAAGETERLRHFIARSTRWMAIASYGAAAAAIPAAPALLVAWVGTGHAVAESLAPWLLAGLTVSLATGVSTVAARGAGRPDLELLPAALGAAVHIALSWLGLRHGDAAVVGPAFFVAMSVWAVAYLAVFTRWSRIPLRITLGAQSIPLLAGVLAGGLAWNVAKLTASRWATDRWSLLGASAATFVLGGVVFLVAWWILDRGWTAWRKRVAES